MASTAARASLPVPQATIGTTIRSRSSFWTRLRMAMATSTISRSAPRPRSTASACAIDSACVTAAPFCIASLVAVVSWPLRLPTIRRRIAVSFHCPLRTVRNTTLPPLPPTSASVSVAFDDFRHGDAKLLFDQYHFTARHQAIVDVDVDRLTDLAIELEHGAGPELQHLAHFHPRATEHGRHFDGDVEHGFK